MLEVPAEVRRKVSAELRVDDAKKEASTKCKQLSNDVDRDESRHRAVSNSHNFKWTNSEKTQ